MKKIFIFIFFAGLILNMSGEDNIIQKFDNIILPLQQDKAANHIIDFPALQKKNGYSVCLRFKAYIQNKVPAGWNNFLGIDVNGCNLGKEMINGAPRLLRRGSFMRTTYSKALTKEWWDEFDGKTCLLMLFGSGTGEIDKRVVSPREEGYNYIIDISDVVNYVVYGADDRIEEAKQNKLIFSNMLLKKYVPESQSKGLFIENLQVTYIPNVEASKWRGAELHKFNSLGQAKAELKNDNFSLKVGASGGLELKIAGETYFIESKFSYPAQPEIQYNHLSINASTQNRSWNPVITEDGSGNIQIKAVSGAYSLERKIKLNGNRIEFMDKIHNNSSQAVGIKIVNLLGISRNPKASNYYVSGRPGADSADPPFTSKNPTIFVAQDQSSLGMVVEDTVYRVQSQMLKKSNTFVIQTPNFGLAPDKNYCFEWALYPLKTKDYFSFINKVRRDWGVNFTIPGPYSMGDNLPPKGMKCSIFNIQPWLDFHNGAKYNWQEYKDIVVPKIKRLHDAVKGSKVLPLVETNLISIDINSIPGGEELPARKGSRRDSGIKYGLLLNKKLTALIDKHSKFADSLIRSEDGRIMIDNYYPWYPHIALMMQPERGNGRYKHFMKQIDFLLNDCKFDGIYADQFIPAAVGGCTFDKWDGYSVVLDKSGHIKSKYYNYAITGASARADIGKRIIDSGKLFVHNDQPVSRENQTIRAISFQEMENDSVNPLPFMSSKPPVFRYQVACHLGTPVMLGLRLNRYTPKDKDLRAKILNKGIITCLRNGLLYYYYQDKIPLEGPEAGGYGPGNHMFPFTPVEINEGFLVGKERTITCISRKVTVDFKESPKCMLFDNRGRYKEHKFNVQGNPGNWTVDVKLDDWNEIAIIKQ